MSDFQATTQAAFAKAEIERKVIFRELDTEQLYSENKLSAILQLGRTPVREALQALEQEDMLKVHARKGVEFLEISAAQQLQLLEIRKEIEPTCIKYAILRGSSEHRVHMLQLAQNILESAQGDEDASLLEALRGIHFAITNASGNPYFHHALARVQSQSRRFWFANKTRDDTMVCSQFHAEIMRSVAIGNEIAAKEQLLKLHEYLAGSALKVIKLSAN